MMSALANSLHKPERFDVYVRKFHAICAMHGIQVGSRGDLNGFMQKLMEDRHLSMDFWSFVGKLSSREGGELSDDQMLAVIVEGVTGGQSSEEDGRVVGDLRAMLAGVDIQGPGKGQVELAPFPPRSETDPPQVDGELRPRVVELPLKARFSRAAFSLEATNDEANHVIASPTSLPPQLDETLVRLGVANLVKQYLEDIDNRIRKLETPPEGETAAVAVADPMTPRSLEEPPEKPPKEEREDPPITFVGNARLVLEPDASALATHKPKGNHPPIRVPLENYSQPKGFGRTVFEVGLALALFEAAFLGYQHRPPLREQIDAFAQDVHNSLVQKIENLWANAAATAHPIAPPPQAPREPILEGISTPPPANTNASAGQAQATHEPLAAAVGSGSSSSKTTDHAEVRAEPESATDRLATADEAGAVRVAPAAMEANLVVSRVPVYPEIAKADRIEGHVMMEAIISKNGFVKRVHVIEGDSRLRSAATEAVYKRLYRPYILNGEPVDVATTVTLDFKLDRWRRR
jgi:Gram-negative bacterial TonB protein C-terminal